MALEDEFKRARNLEVSELADTIESIGFSCTRCGACCKGHDGEHIATIFPDEIRTIQNEDLDWQDVARPMPFGGIRETDELSGETFEWALEVDDCGDCTFYVEDDKPPSGACTIYDERPLICQTYPFSIGLLDEDENVDNLSEPMGNIVEQRGPVQAHECEGLGGDISRNDAVELAKTLKERAIRELEEAMAVRENYERTEVDGKVVHDSEGQKRPDGTNLDSS